MPSNHEHVHLAWSLWSDLKVIPTHGNYGSLIGLINLRVASNAINARRLPIALLVFVLVRPLLINDYHRSKQFLIQQPIPALPVLAEGQVIPSDIVTMHQDWVKAQKADQELFQTVREFHKYKQEEGQSVSSYVLKMKSYIDNLEHLGHAMTQNLSVSLILVSLRKEYDGFVQNYNMHNMGKTVTELHAMLKLHDQTLPPKEVPPTLHAIRA
ncbi:hypothetical protein Tco_1561342 [Tanacetum coccineum]